MINITANMFFSDTSLLRFNWTMTYKTSIFPADAYFFNTDFSNGSNQQNFSLEDCIT
jgi:hypothetical protein